MVPKAASDVMPSQADTRKTYHAPYYVRGLALGIPTYLAAIHLWTWVLYAPDAIAKGGYDFRQSYSAAYMLRTGHASELYNYEAQKAFQDRLVSPQNIPLPFVEPAYEAVLFEPLTRFSFRTAYFLFFTVNVGLLSICYMLLKPWLANLRAVYWWLPIVMFIGFLPAGVALLEGQDAILLSTAFVAAFVLLVKRQEFFAGLVLGLAIFKFQIILPTLFLFFIWRYWRFVLGCSISAVTCLAIGFWSSGLEQTKTYLFLLLSLAGLKPPMRGFDSYPVYWNGMVCVHGIVFELGQRWASHRMLIAITVALSLAVVGWTALRGRQIKSPSVHLLLAVLCSVLVGYHVNIYDLSVLLVVTFVVLDAFLPREQTGREIDRKTALIAALMFTAPVGISWFPSYLSVVAIVEAALLVAIAVAASEGFNLAQIDRG